MRNSRLLIAAALLALGACTGNVTGPELTAPSSGSQDVTSTSSTTTDSSDQPTEVEVQDDTGLLGSGGGR